MDVIQSLTVLNPRAIRPYGGRITWQMRVVWAQRSAQEGLEDRCCCQESRRVEPPLQAEQVNQRCRLVVVNVSGVLMLMKMKGQSRVVVITREDGCFGRTRTQDGLRVRRRDLRGWHLAGGSVPAKA